ncbi:glycosyl hydrolase [Crucibulum laeve]|uniref:Glycosyl hydrolase n=1 Tax=Crucibulum laeve TaxID=68775 RepID=A0A5C3M875_9AGAR|nr:glycosyl hydrolase [Crucibulum laeve]
MLVSSVLSIFSLVILSACSRAVVIVPGATWTDTSGNVIQAHGGGILKAGWVDLLLSSDMVSWTRQNDALTPISGSMISTSNIVERPKVLFNKVTSEYVMWFHSDSSNYGAAQVGVATAKSPCGPYTFKSSFKPLGAESRDMGLYQDDDASQTAYLLYASDNNQNFKISKLDSNYYNVSSQTSVLSGSTLEAPGIIKRNGRNGARPTQ